MIVEERQLQTAPDCRGLRERSCPCGRETATLEMSGALKNVTRCQTCGLFARFPLPKEAELSAFYREHYGTRFPEEQLGLARRNLYEHALAWIRDVQPPPGRLIDVGCGGGALLELSQERGWQATGLDPSTSAVAQARAKGLDAYEAGWPESGLPDATADVVTFVNVLDLFLDPFAALHEAWRVLKPGGILYIRVPNAPIHALLTRLLSPLGCTHLTVLHLFGFGRAALHHHLSRLGFTAQVVRAAPPSQGEAYIKKGESTYFLRTLLKSLDRRTHQLLVRIGLDRLGWGLSLEARAAKAVTRVGI